MQVQHKRSIPTFYDSYPLPRHNNSTHKLLVDAGWEYSRRHRNGTYSLWRIGCCILGVDQRTALRLQKVVATLEEVAA